MALGKLLQHMRQCVAQEDTHHSRRRFVAAKAFLVARAAGRKAQQVRIFVDSRQHRAQRYKKNRVFLGFVGGIQKIFARIGDDAPIVVLAAAVYARKRLFVQQACKIVAQSYLAHQLHHDLVVVAGDIGCGEYAGQLVLAGSDLVVLGLSGYAKAPQLFVQFAHEFAHAFVDAAVVVVLKLLSLGRLRAQKRVAADLQVKPAVEQVLVHKEIFLLRAHSGLYRHRFGIAKRAQHTQSLFVERLHAAQHGGFLVQRFAGIGAERRGNVQRGAQHKSGGGGVPRGVSARLECGAQPAGRKTGSVALAFGKHFAGKIQDRLALLYTIDKAVVLAAARARHGAEPVDVMRRTLLHGPGLHGVCHNIRNLRVPGLALVANLTQRFIYAQRQALTHHAVVEQMAAEQPEQFIGQKRFLPYEARQGKRFPARACPVFSVRPIFYHAGRGTHKTKCCPAV